MQTILRKWDDVKLLDGFPGKYVVMARRSGDKWYIGGINSQTENQKVIIDISKLKTPDGNSVTLITDGDTNRSFIQKQTSVTDSKLEVEMKPNGGFVVVL